MNSFNIEIIPEKGMVCDGKKILFGFSKKEVDTLEDIVYFTLSERNGKDNVKSENGYSYIFGNISVGIFREIKPSDFEETLKEMKRNGIPFENYEDIQKDKQTALHWQTI